MGVPRAGNPFAEGWLDVTKLVSSGFEDSPANELAEKLGGEVYADINGWHLFLRDMKLHNVIAAEISNRIADGMDVEDAVMSVMKQVPVKLGQKTKVPLADLVPNIILDDAVDVVKKFIDDQF